MNRITLRICTLAVATSLLGACTNTGNGEKETGGTLLGAAAGGLVGSQFGSGSGKLAATGIGVLLGAVIGNSVGKSLDAADRQAALAAQQRAYAAPVGQQITWNNPDSGHTGTVTPIRDGSDANGNYCREFQTTVVINGQNQQAYGTACRQPDGSWKVVK